MLAPERVCLGVWRQHWLGSLGRTESVGGRLRAPPLRLNALVNVAHGLELLVDAHFESAPRLLYGLLRRDHFIHDPQGSIRPRTLSREVTVGHCGHRSEKSEHRDHENTQDFRHANMVA